MLIVMLGPPGAGKGTASKMLTERKGFKHVSTGDMLREAISNGTELGKKAKEYMDAGDLVPDDVVQGIVKNRLKEEQSAGEGSGEEEDEEKIILDGFPRTVEQAKFLESLEEEKEIKGVDKVIYLNVPKDIVVQRLTGRRVCSNCGREYHVQNVPPKKEGICDLCGGRLERRDDDKPESVEKRLESYKEKTQPLIDFYKGKDKLKEADASEGPESMYNNILDAIGLD